MSLIYCKSQQYLMDTDNRVITSNEGSLPYSFTNEFKEEDPYQEYLRGKRETELEEDENIKDV